MNEKENELLLIEKAAAGDKTALEMLLSGIQDMVFNLSLRMLGSFHDAEDASQDILIRVMTHLSSFRGESAFTTWVFRIAINHLINYRKHLFARLPPLSFESYGEDILNARVQEVPDLTQDVERALLAEELKLSCTNVMLQCLDAQSRCIFILGTLFRVDSQTAGDILGIRPDAYRQQLSRVRRKMADFLSEYCGEFGKGTCRCINRVNYAIKCHRISPRQLDFTSTEQTVLEVKSAMEELDDCSQQLSFCRAYRSPERLRQLLQELLNGAAFSTVTGGGEEK